MPDLKIERHFNKSPEIVFEFLTKPENVVQWWGPQTFVCEDLGDDMAFDRPGPWTMAMRSPEGNRYKVSGEVTSIDPPNSVEFTWAWHDENDQRGHQSLVRYIVAADQNGKSRLTWLHTGLPDEEAAAGHMSGWNGSLGKLERLIDET